MTEEDKDKTGQGPEEQQMDVGMSDAGSDDIEDVTPGAGTESKQPESSPLCTQQEQPQSSLPGTQPESRRAKRSDAPMEFTTAAAPSKGLRSGSIVAVMFSPTRPGGKPTFGLVCYGWLMSGHK